MQTKSKYQGWLWLIQLFGIKFFGWREGTTPCPKSWRHYFDSGFKPMDALIDDINNQ